MNLQDESVHQSFWQERYEQGNTPWDLAGPSPHFEACLKGEYTDQLPPGLISADTTLIVPGAGRGHDAALFARQGAVVVAVDYAPDAVIAMNTQYLDRVAAHKLKPLCADVFQLASALSDNGLPSVYDGVIEHTCFCAINPKLRLAYVQSMTGLLKPGGFLLGIFWEFDDAEKDGPPFSTSMVQLADLFSESMTIQSMVPVVQNAGGRSGQEYLVRMIKSV